MTYQEFESLWDSKIKSSLLTLEEMRIETRNILLISILLAIIITLTLMYFLAPIPHLAIFGLVIALVVFNKFKPKGYKRKYKEIISTGLLRETKYSWTIKSSSTQEDGIILRFFREIEPTKEREDIINNFRNSGLYFSNFNSFLIEDILESTVNPSIKITELMIRQKQGKNSVVIFRGLLMSLKVHKSFRGETYIKTDSDWGIPIGTPNSRKIFTSTIKKTDLEWGEFEKVLDVHTTDEIEAREIMDPQFMEIVYDWWIAHKKSIRISFKDDHMYLAIAINKNMFEPSIFKSIDAHKKELWEYLDTILTIEKLFTAVEKKYALDIELAKSV